MDKPKTAVLEMNDGQAGVFALRRQVCYGQQQWRLENPGYRGDRACSLTSSNLSHIIPFSFITFLLCSFLHPSFSPHTSSSLSHFPPPLSLFRLLNFFSFFLSFNHWLSLSFLSVCISLCPFCASLQFHFSCFSSFLLSLLPSSSLYHTHLVYSDRPTTGRGTRSGQKIRHGSISAFMGFGISWERQIEKQPT